MFTGAQARTWHRNYGVREQSDVPAVPQLREARLVEHEKPAPQREKHGAPGRLHGRQAGLIQGPCMGLHADICQYKAALVLAKPVSHRTHSAPGRLHGRSPPYPGALALHAFCCLTLLPGWSRIIAEILVSNCQYPCSVMTTSCS